MKRKAIDILKDKHIKIVPVAGTDEKMMTCPFCGKENHFYFNERKDVGVCHRCKVSANGLFLIMAVLGLEREDALRLFGGARDASLSGLQDLVQELRSEAASDGLDSLYTPEVFFKNPMPNDLIDITKKTFPKIFAERDVSYEMAKKTGAKICNSGYYFNRILFPVKTLRSETFTAVTSLTKSQYAYKKKMARRRGEQFRKSLFPKKSFISEMIYGYNEAMNNPNPLILAEGIWDVLALRRLGLNAVGILGNYISYRQAYLISLCAAKWVLIMLDGSVEKNLLKRLQVRISNISLDKEVRICILPDGKDPDESSLLEIKKTIVNNYEYLF